MATPAPTVYVYGQMQDEQGRQFWLRYIAHGSDHEAAATIAIRAWAGARVLLIETFDGEPQKFMPGAVTFYPVGVRPEG